MAKYDSGIFEKMTAHQNAGAEKEIAEGIREYEDQGAAEKEIAAKSCSCQSADISCVGQDCKTCEITQDEYDPQCAMIDEMLRPRECPFGGDCCPYGVSSEDAGRLEECAEFCNVNIDACSPDISNEDCEGCFHSAECNGLQDCLPDREAQPKEERFHAECRSENCPGCDWRHQCPDSSILTEEEKKACSMLCDKCPNQCDFAKGLAAQAMQEKQDMDEELDELKKQNDAALEKEYARLDKELDESKEKVENLLNNLNDKVSASLNRLNEKASVNIEQISKMVNELRHPEDFHDEKETCELECELCQDDCESCVVSQLKPGATTSFADDFPQEDRPQS